jgi:hypothetical protein
VQNGIEFSWEFKKKEVLHKQPNVFLQFKHKAEHKHNVTVGWHSMKNPLLQSREALDKNIELLNPQTKELKEALSSKETQHYRSKQKEKEAIISLFLLLLLTLTRYIFG